MIKAIIIDDEKRARRVLENLLTQECEGVEVIAQCANLPDAVLRINELEPDVVFCDIEMPRYSGLELISFFKEVNFEIIFATGYSQYAIQAFEMSAVDYLLKPIDINKLQIALNRLKERLQRSNMQTRLEVLKDNIQTDEIYKIALPVSDGLIFLNVKDLSYLEASGSYTKVWLQDGSNLLVSKNLRFFSELLQERKQFYRIHRSSLININSIKKYNKSESFITLDINKNVKIARDKKGDFEAYIAKIKL